MNDLVRLAVYSIAGSPDRGGPGVLARQGGHVLHLVRPGRPRHHRASSHVRHVLLRETGVCLSQHCKVSLHIKQSQF